MGNLPRARSASRPANERILTVEAGEVMCPRRGIVDIDECWICPAYLGMSGGHFEGLVCGTEPVMSFAGRPAIQ